MKAYLMSLFINDCSPGIAKSGCRMTVELSWQRSKVQARTDHHATPTGSTHELNSKTRLKLRVAPRFSGLR